MDVKTFLVAFFAATAGVAWPSLGKVLRINGGLVACIVLIVAVMVVCIMSHKDIAKLPTLSVNTLTWVIAISVANGLAIYAYAEKAADPNVRTGIFLVTIFILQVCIAPFGDWLITVSTLTLRQIAGLGLAIPGMWLLANIAKTN